MKVLIAMLGVCWGLDALMEISFAYFILGGVGLAAFAAAFNDV